MVAQTKRTAFLRGWFGRATFVVALILAVGVGLVVGYGSRSDTGPADATDYPLKRLDTDLVAVCPDDGAYALYGYESPDGQPADADEKAPLFDSPDGVIADFIEPIASSASPDNPMLDQLGQVDRDREIEWLVKYFEPARSLTMSQVSVETESTTLFEVVSPDGYETSDALPSGSIRWSLGYAAVERTRGGSFFLKDALLCSDALTTREGQLVIQEFNDDLYQQLIDDATTR